MSNPKDPTDAPFIPSMGGFAPDPSDVDSAMPMGGEPAAEPDPDPIAVAQRLAEEAELDAPVIAADPGAFPDEHGDADAWEDISEEEARAVADGFLARAQAKASEREAKAAAPEPAKEDPRALAKRLAEEAKKKAQAAAPKEDPRALAKRLAEEAKKKAQAAAPKEDARALAKRLAEEAKKKAQAAKPKPAKAAAPKAEAPKDLMSRMGKPRSKRKSAAEILAEARAAEAAQAEAKAEAKKQAKKKAALAKQMAAEAKAAAEAKRREQEAAPPPPSTDAAPPVAAIAPGLAVQQILKGATIVQVKHPGSTDVLKAVWSAHLARAQASTDLNLAVGASAMLGALERVGASGIAAVEARYAGMEHAIFIETESGTLIAAVAPAHVYLAGI